MTNTLMLSRKRRIILRTDSGAPLWRILRLVVPLAILALLWIFADGKEIAAQLSRANPWWLVAAVLTCHLQTVLCALRWRMTAARLGQDLPRGLAVREYYLAQFLNQTVPGGVAGDVARAVRVRGDDMARSGAAVAIERISGQLGMLAILLVALPLAMVQGLMPVRLGLLPFCLGVGIAVALSLAMRFAPRRLHKLRDHVREGVVAIWQRQAALGLAIAGCNIVTFAFCAAAIGIDLGPLAAAAFVPLILTAMLIPASVAGWGFREGAAALLLPLAGAGAQGAIATSVAFGAAILVAALPGAFFLRRPRMDRRLQT